MSRVVLIVGASSGIGMHTAKRFVECGDIVVNMSRRDCEIVGVHNIQLDVSKQDYIDNAWRQFVAKYDRLDILIYSAGFSMASPLEYVKQADYRYLFEVNLFGYMNFLQKCLPYLKASQGVSCVVGSTGGIAPIPYDSYYSSSKAAVNMLTSCLQYELLPQGIKALCVMPGGTKTHFTFKRKEYSPESIKEYAAAMQSATMALENIEQGGMKADRVAKTIYRRCTRIGYASIYASGITNKLVSLFIRLMPQSVIYLIIKAKFHLKQN